MKNLSLKWRVLLWIAAIQAIAMLAGGSVILFNAREAIDIEVSAAQQNARSLVLSTIASLMRNSDPQTALRELPKQLVQPRHIRLSIVDIERGLLPAPPLAGGAIEDHDHAPDWFLRWIEPSTKSILIPVSVGMRTYGQVLIETAPSDEASEIWQEVVGLFLVALVAYFTLLTTLTLIVTRTLRPLSTISDTLHQLETGTLTARTAPIHDPDLGPIAARVNALADGLSTGAQERRELSARITRARDSERKEIAMELHDELGPCLFGLKVEAEAILSKSGIDAGEHAQNITRISNQIQQVNTRLLNSLRPMAIGQLPLVSILGELTSDFAQQHKQIDWTFAIPKTLPDTDEAVDLTIYRIIQEGITNALKHASAEKIEVQVTLSEPKSSPQINVSVRDNGTGLSNGWSEGGGLLGMRARISALNGKLSITCQSGAGANLNATIPVVPQ